VRISIVEQRDRGGAPAVHIQAETLAEAVEFGRWAQHIDAAGGSARTITVEAAGDGGPTHSAILVIPIAPAETEGAP